MADFIEGKRPVIEALRTGVPIKSILMADNVQRDGLIEDILRKAKRAGATVEMVPRKVLDGKSDRGSHQGVMAKAAPFPYVGIGDVIDAAGKSAEQHDGRALVIILDHITDAGNLGAVSRSAEAVGACGIVIPNKRSAHVEASTYKSSAGAIAHVPVAQVSNLKGKIALVMGNEQEGISRLVMEHCDFLVKLPIEGEVASLNVAQAATACMYEWLRQNQ